MRGLTVLDLFVSIAKSALRRLGKTEFSAYSGNKSTKMVLICFDDGANDTIVAWMFHKPGTLLLRHWIAKKYEPFSDKKAIDLHDPQLWEKAEEDIMRLCKAHSLQQREQNRVYTANTEQKQRVYTAVAE
jgi:hypothetical protein